MRQEAARLGEVVRYGASVEGRELYAVTVGDGPTPLVVTAAIHGLEYIGVRVALAVLGRGPIPGATLWVVPTVNPDAYDRTWAVDGDAPVSQLRKNARGVDLNRNFPLPFGSRTAPIGLAGSHSPRSATFRGPTPLSEPETEALTSLLERIGPHGAVSQHAFMGAVIPARVTRPGDWFGYSRLCAAFRRGQLDRVRYARLSSPIDVFTGELEDWLHHALGCWAVCVESFRIDESLRQHLRAPTSFWRFNPRAPDPIVERDARGVRALLTAMTEAPPLPVRPRARTFRPRW